MNTATRRAKNILAVLSEKLSDELLTAWFPHFEPEEVRDLLRQTADSCRLQGSIKQHNRHGKDVSPKSTAKAVIGTGGEGQYLLYTDGASRGNPGEAGAGFVILDSQRNELLTGSTYLGTCTNNVAEYQALISGLTSAVQLGCRDLRIFLDSELIVRQIQRVYKVKNANLKTLFNKVMALLKKCDHWDIQHVPRSQNSRADELANRGIDEK